MDVMSKKCDACNKIEHSPTTDMWYAVSQADGVILTGFRDKLQGFLNSNMCRDTTVLDVCSLKCAHKLVQVHLQRHGTKLVHGNGVLPVGYEDVRLTSVVIPMPKVKLLKVKAASA